MFQHDTLHGLIYVSFVTNLSNHVPYDTGCHLTLSSTNNEIKFFEWRQLSTLPFTRQLFSSRGHIKQRGPGQGLLLLLYFSGFWLEMAICQGQVTCSGHWIITPVTFKPLNISQHRNDSDIDGGNQCWIWLMRALIITLINYLHNSDLTRRNNYRSLLYFQIDSRYNIHSCSEMHNCYKGGSIHLRFCRSI